jgi:hypothetical protein
MLGVVSVATVMLTLHCGPDFLTVGLDFSGEVNTLIFETLNCKLMVNQPAVGRGRPQISLCDCRSAPQNVINYFIPLWSSKRKAKPQLFQYLAPLFN